MYEIIKVYDQPIPAVRFIGIKYGDEDRVGGSFGKHWGDWFENNRFQKLEELVNEELRNTYVDLPKGKLGVCWMQGPEEELFINEEKCEDELTNAGYEITSDKEGAGWFFERYVCPRFTVKDEEGRAILDICHYIK